MSNDCVGCIQIFDIGDQIFLAFEGIEELCQSSKSGEESNVLPFLPVILLSEQVQVLVENGFAKIYCITTPIEGKEFCFDKIEENNYKINNKEKDEENLIPLAQKILIGRNLKKRKRELFGNNVPSTLLKIRKIDYLIENKNNDEINKQINTNEIESFDNKEELKQIINELRLKNSKKIILSTNNSTSYVFRDLWRKGFYLLSGTKFGCDYLAYEKPPDEQHSIFMVICNDVNKSLNLYNLISTSRVSTQVKKKILLAVVSPGNILPYYLEINWWKGDGNLMLFFSFFKSLVGREVIIELKNDLSICGTLHSVDQYLNVKVTDITVADVERHPHMISVKNCFIRGSVIRYVHLPSDGIDTQLLQEATRKEVLQSRQQTTK
ncbi:Sm domain-containing protein [Meloidogyne graminicola]|uniref:U6 snRNA-associated Sm-like protein LSm2 n=1 Tax=Meloidogyne graminicola TaxID=189291 RepID=A0A8S9ZZK1_9BILA|nr:Sm domain-containing protein [Meloidogyne graminicola]